MVILNIFGKSDKVKFIVILLFHMDALIIVDMIHEFVDGKFGSKRAKSIVEKINEVIKISREKNFLIIFTKDSHKENDPELSVWGPHAMDGSFASEIISELDKKENDIVIKKNTYDSFFNTDLHKILQENNVKRLFFTGVSTDICVLHSVAHAFFLGYETYVIEECTESINERNKEFGLKYMKNIYGTKIIKMKELGEIK